MFKELALSSGNIEASLLEEATAILLCEDLGNLGSGLDLREIGSLLESASPGVSVEIVPDLCNRFEQLSQIKSWQGASRVVLGLCCNEYSQVELQSQARKQGLDPFGIEVVPLGTLCSRVHPRSQATWKAKILLSAAVARTLAYQAGGPENVKLFFASQNERMTRRSLFTVPPIGYRPVPSIHRARCAAKTGCHLCVDVCPKNALRKIGGHISLRKASCEGCGVCLTVCPREAFDFPGQSLVQYEAQFDALLKSASEENPTGILLTCQKSANKLDGLAGQDISYSHRWLPAVVPCLGMVTPTWIFQLLAHGAAAVTLISCGSHCSFRQEGTVGGRVNYCRKLLPQMGQPADRVQVLNISKPEKLIKDLQKPPQKANGQLGRLKSHLLLRTGDTTVQAIQSMIGNTVSMPNVSIEHPYSPFGVVNIRTEGCTGCLTCANVCPTGALVSESGEGSLSLIFKASLCTGCGICVGVCPEAVLQVNKLTNLDLLSLNQMILHKDHPVVCKSCGSNFASQALLQRVETVLIAHDKSMYNFLRDYCPSCRSPLCF